MSEGPAEMILKNGRVYLRRGSSAGKRRGYRGRRDRLRRVGHERGSHRLVPSAGTEPATHGL